MRCRWTIYVLVVTMFLLPLAPLGQADPGGGDAGDNFFGATEVGAGTSHSGSLTDTTDEDWYKFSVTEGQGINVSLRWTSSNSFHIMNIWLYDPDEVYKGSTWAWGDDTVTYVTASGEKTGYYRIRIYYGSGDIPGDYTFRITLHDPPTAPKLYSPTGITEDSMSISWSQYGSSDFSVYKVYKGNYPDAVSLVEGITSKTTTSYLFEELSPSTDHYFRVRVDTTKLSFSYSAQTSGTTLAKYDPSTSDITIVLYAPTEISDSSMTLTWNRYSETDFATYELHRSSTTGFSPSAGSNVADIPFQDQTSYAVTGLSSNTAYYWLVRVKNSADDHFLSEQTSGTTLPSSEVAPPSVTLNQPSSITTSSMNLLWSPTSASDFFKYELHMSTDPLTGPKDGTLVASFYKKAMTSYTVNGLTEDTLYYFMVSTYDKYMLHSESDVVSDRTVYVNKPPTPVEVSPVTTVTNDYAVIEWTQCPDKDFAKYEVHIGSHDSFTPSGSTLKATLTDKDELAYTVSDLEEGTDHYVIVRVIDSGDLYTDSNPPVMFTTLAENQPPQTPVVNAATGVTAIEAYITWSENGDTDFARYELHMSTEGGDFDPRASTLISSYNLQSKTDHHFSGLGPSTTYYIKVRVYDDHDLHTDSSAVSFKTLDPPSISVTLFTPVNISGSSMSIFWTVDNTEDVSRYEVHMSGTPGFTLGAGTLYATMTQKKVKSIDIEGLMPGTHYYFRVRAYDISGSVTDSKQVSAMTSRISSGEGGSAVLYSPVLITRDSVTLEWQEAINLDFRSYEVHRSTTAGFAIGTGTKVETIKDKSVTTTTITGLKSSTDYYFQLRIDSDSGTLDSRQVSGTTLPSTVDFPSAVSLERPTMDTVDKEITLTWTQGGSKDFLKYEVHESGSGNFTPSRATLVKTIYKLGTTSVTLPFERDTSFYKVKVYNTYWLYSDSEELTAYPTKVELVDIYVSTERTIQLVWTQNSDPDFEMYTLYMSESPDLTPSDQTKVVEIEDYRTTSYTIEGLEPDKAYYFKVKVENKVGLEVLSNEVEASTSIEDRQDELFDLAWTGIWLAVVALIILIVAIIIILVQASRISRLRHDRAMMREQEPVPEQEPTSERETPPPPPPPPPPGPPEGHVPHVTAFKPRRKM